MIDAITAHCTPLTPVMPLVKYTWLHAEGHECVDEELFSFSEDIHALLMAQVPVLQKGEGKLLKFTVTNPLIHEHAWQRTSKQGERVYYECSHCGVVAWRRISLFHGPIGTYNREELFKAAKYAQCRTPLKEMPPSTLLFSKPARPTKR